MREQLKEVIKNAWEVKYLLKTKEGKSKQRYYISGLITAYRVINK